MFNRSIWNQPDIVELEKYLDSIKNESKIEWTKRVINTNLNVLAIPLPKLKEMAKEMKKGNFISFLDIMPTSSFEIITISGFLINEIKDFKVQEKYIKKYASLCDTWSTCDTLKFRIKNNEDNYLKLAKELIKSKKTFVRRVGIDILFSLLKTDKYLNDIYQILDSFENEKEYYVNMANAWLMSVLMVKHRDQTLKYLEHSKVNNDTMNKFIQKCRDSYRISPSDKEMLLKYKR